MAKVKYVSKKKILEAIKTEPLAAGYFVEYDWNRNKISTKRDCKVCAVGSVLRKAGLTNTKIEKFGDELAIHGAVSPEDLDPILEIEEFLEEKKYLHALSVKFELEAHKNKTIFDDQENPLVSDKVRKVLTKFVEKHFPNRIKLDPRF